jgi:transposase
MRKSFDGLCGLVQNNLHRNPLSGDVFIFLNKLCTHIKLLHWEEGGFVLYYKRLERGRISPPKMGPDSIQRSGADDSWYRGAQKQTKKEV